MNEPGQPAQRNLIHFTPLRYPGGKAKLAAFVKKLMENNDLLDGDYVEPYAGGAAIALELLFHEYVDRIYINDVSRLVHAFWTAVLDYTDALCKLIRDTPLTVAAWDKQRRIIEKPTAHDALALGFATFFLNRTNRSGILNGGIIGGRDQTGPWKIDARYNAPELVNRVQSIAAMRERISLTRKDAVKFLESGVKKWRAKTFIYLDPPYYVKGRDLYHDFYNPEDHAIVAQFVRTITKQRWIVSYDNAPAIRGLYRGSPHVVYDIGYSARSASRGSEVMFFGNGLKVPPIVGSIRLTEDHTRKNG